MIIFFGEPSEKIIAVSIQRTLDEDDQAKLQWLFGGKRRLQEDVIPGQFVGPRTAMITPWSTNAVEITQNMSIHGIRRIEEFNQYSESRGYDPMVAQKYTCLDQDIFTVDITPDPIFEVDDINAYNHKEGLALSKEEIEYLNAVSDRIGRKLTDSEVFGFSQVNSEHCRHKIFNGKFIIDGEERSQSLFQLIKETSGKNPNTIVSAYKDNVAFIAGPEVVQFAPERPDVPSYHKAEPFESVISLKAETHNFPTTVEPFSGAATGSGGEIRDRLAGGRGAIPLAGTAVYMTSYSRLNPGRPWEKNIKARKWLYQTPIDILIKASNGASDFGNKFGQPLICGSLLTFEHEANDEITAFDKVIMLAGGIGYGKASQSLKEQPESGDKIVVLGGDNYRIGMGGAAVSSADTGAYGSGIELNAVQRSNPEMQMRVANAIRGLIESDHNPIVSIHDHGAGGHLNCLSELVEETGGHIDLDALPIGDQTLSAKEIIGNESQERMGLLIHSQDVAFLKKVADRERSPMYVVGEVTGDHRFVFQSGSTGDKPMDMNMNDLFGSSPKTIMRDSLVQKSYQDLEYDPSELEYYIEDVLKLESVACKDWLTNKVDRCVRGKVAKQQCAGSLQLPLNNCGVMALDYESPDGVATSIGHAPGASLINPAKGARLSIVEALTNIIWAPLKDGLKSVSLSANWMWPCNNKGEDARLFKAVEAVSRYAIDLGINVPTGKDSLSMKQKYRDREVKSPGTVIISAAGHCINIEKVVEPVFRPMKGAIYFLPLSDERFALGGSSFAQTRNAIGQSCPDTLEAANFVIVFNTIQHMILQDQITAGHDVSAGGLLTTLLEMCFGDLNLGGEIDLSEIQVKDDVHLLLSESPGIVIQSEYDLGKIFAERNIRYFKIGHVTGQSNLSVKTSNASYSFEVQTMRDIWYETSYLLDEFQTAEGLALERYKNYKLQPLRYQFPSWHNGIVPPNDFSRSRPKAAILREKGSNSEREMAHAMYLAGWDVKDVHMTDLMEGRETLEDIRFLGAVGGFSNSDVLGSAKGWAGTFLYNENAKKALENFFSREDVLSIGICNGCQLFVELKLINPELPSRSKLDYNDSGKHESAFTSVRVEKNNSVMLSNFEGSTLGVWISHGEGKFVLPHEESDYHIVAKYGYEEYPSNPNGSDYNTAMICSKDGRHLVTMPHIERSIFKWNWAHYPDDRDDKISPWIQAFINAREWVELVNNEQ